MKINIMSFLSILFIALTIFLSCNNAGGPQSGSNGNGYEISGTVNNGAGYTMYLDAATFTGSTSIDTVTIGQDGSFSLNGVIDKPGLFALRIDQQHSWLIVMNPGESITVSADFNNPPAYQLNGTYSVKALHGFMAQFGSSQQQIQGLYQQLSAAQMTGKTPEEIQQMNAQYQMMVAQANDLLKNFADSVQNPILGIFAANALDVEAHLEYLNDYTSDLESSGHSSTYLDELSQKVERIAKTAVGSTAPDLQLEDPEGNVIALSSLKGNVVLLDFWASWCTPCRKENPNVVNTYNNYKDKGFTVYSVSLDGLPKQKNPKEAWLNAIEKDGLVWDSHVSDLKGWSSSGAAMYGVQSIPATFLIGADGKIIGKNLRGIALEQKLVEIFGE